MDRLDHQPTNTATLGVWSLAAGSAVNLRLNVAETYDLDGKKVTFRARTAGNSERLEFTASSANATVAITDQAVDLAIPPSTLSEHDGETSLADLAACSRTEWAVDFSEPDGPVEYRIQGDIEWIPPKGAFTR